jgi:hypothetical protein
VEGVSYSVSTFDYPVETLAGLTAEALLASLRDVLVEQFEGTLAGERPLVLEGYPGKAFALSSQEGETQLRLYLVGPRAYLLIVSPYSSDDPFADTFLSSLELTDPPPPLVPASGGSGSGGMKH